jgi:Zn-dependent protease/CBS domain-containing protein
MFRKGIRLPFNLAGIPLYLDLSFLLILPILVWLTTGNLATFAGHLGIPTAVFTGPLALVLGLVAVVGLFACVVLHELGHSITARRYGVNVRRITLWFLGGVAEFEDMPRQRGAEAVVAIAGPIVSFALAAVFWGLTQVVPVSAGAAWLVCFYLMAVNLMLGLFNLIPAMPMDGGRILRSLLALRLPYARATAIAGTVAKGIAILLGVWGLMSANVWTIVLAFFVFNAARNETRQTVITEMLKGLRVGDLMNREVRSVPASIPVGELAHYAATLRHTGFTVVDHLGRVIGAVGVDDIGRARADAPVWQIMTSDVPTIGEDADAVQAIMTMSQRRTGHLIAVDAFGRTAGIITMTDLVHAIDGRMAGYQRVQPPPQPGAVYVQRLDVPPTGAPYQAYPPSEPVGYTPADVARDPQRYARPV